MYYILVIQPSSGRLMFHGWMTKSWFPIQLINSSHGKHVPNAAYWLLKIKKIMTYLYLGNRTACPFLLVHSWQILVDKSLWESCLCVEIHPSTNSSHYSGNNYIFDGEQSYLNLRHQSLHMKEPFRLSTLMHWPHQICITSKTVVNKYKSEENL